MKVCVDNPFQYNYVFSKEDMERQRIGWKERIETWHLPMFVQIADGFVFHYKTDAGRYWLFRVEAYMKDRV